MVAEVVTIVGQVQLVPQDASDASKALAKLRAFLGFVRDDVELGAVILVVFNKPVNQKNVLFDLELVGLLLNELIDKSQSGFKKESKL